MIGILDYGMGNLRSVEKALAFLGAEARIQDHLSGIDKLIIPGVGAFGAAMRALAPMKAEIQAFARSGQPLLGICLGQQLLFETSEELGAYSGLEILGGTVRYLPTAPGLKIPHMGWNALTWRNDRKLGTPAEDGRQVYFVHSLYTDCADPADIAATATYGIDFPAAVERGNVWGTQFHPEKSGDVGLAMLRRFTEC